LKIDVLIANHASHDFSLTMLSLIKESCSNVQSPRYFSNVGDIAAKRLAKSDHVSTASLWSAPDVLNIDQNTLLCGK